MFATAPATTRPARSSRGREMMRTTRPPVVDGLSLALQAASSDTSTSTTARIQPSYAIVTDFFNGLLETMITTSSGDIRWRDSIDDALDQSPSIAEWSATMCPGDTPERAARKFGNLATAKSKRENSR